LALRASSRSTVFIIEDGPVSAFFLHGQVAQHGIVELEGMLQFGHHGLVGFDVHAQVVGLGQLVDEVGQLAATPVFHAVHLPPPAVIMPL
jgi:hypothetical protein